MVKYDEDHLYSVLRHASKRPSGFETTEAEDGEELYILDECDVDYIVEALELLDKVKAGDVHIVEAQK